METRAPRNIFGLAWTLLVRNGAIVVPGLVVGALVALVQFALAPNDEAALRGTIWTNFALWVVQIVSSILSITYTTGMANAAWKTGRARFSDGRRAFRQEGGNVFVAMVALFALGTIAAALAPFTFSLSLLVCAFFFIYSMPAAVVGDRPGLVAIAESAEIAFNRPLRTLLLVVGIAVVAVVAGSLALWLIAASFAGPLLSQILLQFVIAYVVLVVVGEYRALRGLGVLA